jgi:hypothetical protein
MEKVHRIVLIQKDLYEQIRAIAQREHRSLSAQIVHFLQEAVALDQSAARLGPASQAAKARGRA